MGTRSDFNGFYSNRNPVTLIGFMLVVAEDSSLYHNQDSSKSMFSEKSVCIELSLSDKGHTQWTAAETTPYKFFTRTRFIPSSTLHHYQTSIHGSQNQPPETGVSLKEYINPSIHHAILSSVKIQIQTPAGIPPPHPIQCIVIVQSWEKRSKRWKATSKPQRRLQT